MVRKEYVQTHIYFYWCNYYLYHYYFLVPIFQFAGFIGDGFNEMQNIFQEMEKYKEEFEWQKEHPSSPNDNSV